MQRSFTFVLLIVVCFVVLAAPVLAQEDMSFPLAGRGPYDVSQRRLEFTDASRDDRPVNIVLWYPAVVPSELADELTRAVRAHLPIADLAPNLEGGPYPLVLYSHDYGGTPTEFRSVLEPLVSHGFVVAGIDHRGTTSAMSYVDRPLDALFTLDQLEALNEDPQSDLAGLIDLEKVGAMGLGSGAYTTTALSGARIDPQAASDFAEWIEPLIVGYSIFPDWSWSGIENYHDQFAGTESDGLWTATTDPGTQAVIAYQPCGIDLFGARGVAEAAVPTLIVGGTQDIACDAEFGAGLLANQLTGAEHQLVLLNSAHGPPLTGGTVAPDLVLQLVHAFLGMHLQGEAENAVYLTEAYANTLDQVEWGIGDFMAVDPANIRDFTFSEGGSIGLGESVAGIVETAGDRIGYDLSLAEGNLLNLTAHGTGRRTDSPIFSQFDPVLYILNDQGEVVFWSDELSLADNFSGNLDAGFESLDLPAGDYTLVVGGFRMAGPYELTVEEARPAA
ncbi:MAG: hypothetical protein JNL34_16465 [Anaerolineae bacterium]|nr:hypothetical protein [Anaerolineae bacterium]